jgi:hypothetical protein
MRAILGHLILATMFGLHIIRWLPISSSLLFMPSNIRHWWTFGSLDDTFFSHLVVARKTFQRGTAGLRDVPVGNQVSFAAGNQRLPKKSTLCVP